MDSAHQQRMLALFKGPIRPPMTTDGGDMSDEHKSVAKATTPRLPPTASSPIDMPVADAANGSLTPLSATRTATPSSAFRSASNFFETPLTEGPFNPSKYGKPKNMNRLLTMRIDASTTPSNTRHSTPTPVHQSSKTCVDIETLSHSTLNAPTTSTRLDRSQSASSICSSSPNFPNLSGSANNQATLRTTSGTQSALQQHKSEALATSSISAKPAVDFTSHTQYTTSITSVTSNTSQVPDLRSASLLVQYGRPDTKGRPRTRPVCQLDLEAPKMSNSDRVKSYSIASTSAHPGESPQDYLRRIQRAAVMRHNVNARRRNKHDTASPEVLAYIRRPLDPGVSEVVEHRVEHYWMVGNENLPAETSLEVEPDWPECLNDSDIKQEKSLYKKSKELVLTTSVGRVDSPAMNRRSDPRWVTSAEVRAPPRCPTSNAWGSGPSSATTAESQDSVRAQGGGGGGVKLAKRDANETSLLGWDGKMQPPPVDWHDRPRFDNNSVEHQNHFNNWGDARAGELARAIRSNAGNERARELTKALHPNANMFRVLDQSQVLDLSNHADGLGFVLATTTVNARNADYYGYAHDSEVKELASDLPTLTEGDLEGANVVKLEDPSMAALVDETTEVLVQRWIGQNGWLKDKRVPTRKVVAPPPPHYETLAAPEAPELRISLRPATVTDIPGMARIYNWYVENSPKTTEFDTIPESDMRGRFEDVRSNKLPFIVAVARNRGRGLNGNPAGRRVSARRGNVSGHPVTNTNPAYQGMTEEETIVGWACASDFTASDYVERITAECELFVANKARQFGVGKALIDKLLEACDRGYLKQGSYDWRCAPDLQHLYCAGGGRNLHKLYFVIRKWNKPVKPLTNGSSRHSTNGGWAQKPNDQDDEWDAWLKKWMQSWGFEEEGVLKRVGAKNGRFLDVVYMGRETMWQPQEGKIPDPLPGTF